MKFEQDHGDSNYVITAYDDNGIAVNEKRFRESFIISPSSFQQDWDIRSVIDINASHFEQLLELQPEVIILGTGMKLVFPAVEHYASLIRQNIGIEFMDNGAACRTYNILISEGRNVAAGIILDLKSDSEQS